MEAVLYSVFGILAAVAGASIVAYLLFAPQESKVVHVASVLSGSLLAIGTLSFVLEERTGAVPPMYVMAGVAIVTTFIIVVTVRRLNY